MSSPYQDEPNCECCDDTKACPLCGGELGCADCERCDGAGACPECVKSLDWLVNSHLGMREAGRRLAEDTP